MKPLISVIICVYNNKKYLPYAVESVTHQDFQDYEIILLDDGSNDGTERVVDALAENYQKIKAYHQENKWIYPSFNRAISLSNGEYILILNSDDRLVEGSLEMLREKIEKYDYPDVIWSQVISNYYDIDKDIYTEKKAKTIPEEYYMKDNDALGEKWVELLNSECVITNANLYKRTLFDDVRFKEDWVGADQILNIELAKRVNATLVISDRFYNFMDYSTQGMNTSGRIYEYDGDMYDYICKGHKELFEMWNINETYPYVRRIQEAVAYINLVRKKMNDYDLEYCLEYLFKDVITDFLKEALERFPDRKEEIEARLLSASLELLRCRQLEEDSKFSFVYKMLEAFSRYEKDNEDWESIVDGINNVNNPYHIGAIFYKKLSRE